MRVIIETIYGFDRTQRIGSTVCKDLWTPGVYFDQLNLYCYAWSSRVIVFKRFARHDVRPNVFGQLLSSFLPYIRNTSIFSLLKIIVP